jgi:putative hydrolase of the HAD superfamily
VLRELRRNYYRWSRWHGSPRRAARAVCDRHDLVIIEERSAPSSAALLKVHDRDGQAWYLKLEASDSPIENEYRALRIWDGKRVAPEARRLEPGVLLVEDLGGESLLVRGTRGVDLRAVGSLVRQLHVTSSDEFPGLSDHVATRHERLVGTRRLPHRARRLASDAFQTLPRQPREPVLLHGDLHAGNVVLTASGPRVLDPYGLIGDGAYDVAFLAATLPAEQEQALHLLHEGYGHVPRLWPWFCWVAVYRLDNAIRYGTAQTDELAALVDRLELARRPQPNQRIAAVCFDFGNTLVDEATEQKDADGATLTAELLPGASDVLHELSTRGYRLALIADGRLRTYENVLRQHGLRDLFSSVAASQAIGVEKPDRRMFMTALDALDIGSHDVGRVVMVGNRLDRDVAGSNGVGMISVWLNWSDRYPVVPANKGERPDHTIATLSDLLPLLERLENGD